MGGDRSSLRLAPSDVELIRAVAAANRRTVVVIQSGSAVITTEWVAGVPAIVQAWYGGAEAGPGLSTTRQSSCEAPSATPASATGPTSSRCTQSYQTPTLQRGSSGSLALPSLLAGRQPSRSS